MFTNAEFDVFMAGTTKTFQNPIHGDLFLSHTLFEATNLSAIIDFYNAAISWVMYDLAIW